MEIKTIKITTSGGHEIVLKEEINAREFIELRDVWLNKAKITGSGVDDVGFAGITGSMVKDHENKSIEIVVVSVDEKTENIFDEVMKLSATDYQEIVAEVQKITSGKEGAGTSTDDS